MLAREDFKNMDQLLRERRLNQALESSPYMRLSDETNVLASFVADSWPVAKDLGPERVFQLAKCVAYSTFSRGEHILEEGQESRSFFIIVKGSVNVIRAGEVVANLPSGGCFGENAVSNGGVTNASCVAHTESVGLLVITKTDYDNIMTDILQREKCDATQIIKRVPMFHGWARSRIDCVVRMIRRVRKGPGEVVVRQGDPPTNVYFISDGRVACMREVPITTHNMWPTTVRSWKRIIRSSYVPIKLSELERGSFFGERAVVESSPCAATVTTLTSTVLLSIDKNDFLTLLIQFHKLDDIRILVRQVYPNDDEILRKYRTENATQNVLVAASANKNASVNSTRSHPVSLAEKLPRLKGQC
jgi:CRP-like cAMP-binding protein